MDFVNLLITALVSAGILQLVTFVYAVRARRVDSIDIAWGLSFIAIVVGMQLVRPTFDLWVVVTELLVLVWGLRLAWHIYRRFLRSDKQDERYTQILEAWPARYRNVQVLVKIFLLQAVLAVVISLPVIIVHQYPPQGSLLVYAGVTIWIVGFMFELIADRQLRMFLAQPKRPELMTTGLWRYSRHPNYFGEVTMWWGIALIALQTPLGLLGLVGAATITVLICFVSGVPLAEKRSARKSGWDEYRRRTSVLFPLPPR
ncbi:MAG: DUF1295 domain-containing protein [Candidatus Saccharimonas sp.]